MIVGPGHFIQLVDRGHSMINVYKRSVRMNNQKNCFSLRVLDFGNDITRHTGVSLNKQWA